MSVCISMKFLTKELPREFWQERVEETMSIIKIQLLKLIEDHCKVYL